MPCTVNLIKSPYLDSEVTGPKGKPITAVLLSGHVVNLPSKYLRLYPQIRAAFNPGQRSFSLLWSATSTEHHNWSKGWDNVTIERPALKGIFTSMPYTPRLREHAEEKTGRMEQSENEERVEKRCLLEAAQPLHLGMHHRCYGYLHKTHTRSSQPNQPTLPIGGTN